MIDGDIGKTLGQLLHDELDLPGSSSRSTACSCRNSTMSTSAS